MEEIRWKQLPAEQGGGLGGSQMAQAQEEKWHWEKRSDRNGGNEDQIDCQKGRCGSMALDGKGRREGKTHQKGDLVAVEQT